MKMYRENFGFNKFNKKFMLSMFSVYIFFFVVFLSVAFSAFESDLVMKDIKAEVKFMPDDARVSYFASTNNLTGNAIASNTDYNYNRVYGDILLPNNDSSVVYEVQVTNLGNAKIGISDITNSNPNLDYTISGYNIGDLIQDENGRYKLGTVITFYITLHYAEGVIPTQTLQSFNLELEFKQFFSVTYHGVPGEESHPAEIMEGRDLVIKTELTSIDRLKITQDTVFLTYGEHYIYDEATQTLTVKNVGGDLLLSYRDVAYLISLFSDDGFYKEASYRTTIKSIDFVDYVDTTNAVKTYDLSENKDGSITGWVMSNADGTYHLYIGSIYDIYARNMGKAFYKMTGLRTINFKNLNTSESTSFAYTFYDTGVETLDLSTFNTAKAESMADMFASMDNLITLDVSNFNTENVTSMFYMFGGSPKLEELDISTFDTANVHNMAYMFSGMTKLKNLKLGDYFNTSSVTTMEYMFMGLSSIESLDLSKFKTENLETTKYMFHDCNAIKHLDLSSFNTQNILNMSYMFYGMDNLTSVDLSSFDTSKVIRLDGMFADCGAITSLDLSHFNTEKVTSMEKMFNNMYSLQSLDISSFTTTSLETVLGFAENCTVVQTIDMSGMDFNSNSIIIHTNMFAGTSRNVVITAKNADSKTWLEARLDGIGTVVVLGTPDSEEPDLEETDPEDPNPDEPNLEEPDPGTEGEDAQT